MLFAASIGVTIFMAARAASATSPSAMESVLLIVVAAGFQAASAVAFGSSGRADPALARTAVRRLVELTARAQSARKVAQVAYESLSAVESKKTMGLISVELSYLEEGIAGGALDWAEFHPDAVRKLEEKTQ